MSSALPPKSVSDYRNWYNESIIIIRDQIAVAAFRIKPRCVDIELRKPAIADLATLGALRSEGMKSWR
jgi:hypothetical protein